MAGCCAEINPPLSPLIPLKAFLEIDYTQSLPPLWITAARFQFSFFFLRRRYGHLFHYTARVQSLQREHQSPAPPPENNALQIAEQGIGYVRSPR